MTTTSVADKSRLTIRGVQDGRTYLIVRYAQGWWVQDAPIARPPKRRREWAGPKKDLTEHLDALSRHGLEALAPIKTEVPSCRF